MLIRPSRPTILMRCALEFSRLGTCPRKQVGALFATDNRIISTGYNGAPSEMPHCNHKCTCPPSQPIEDIDGHLPGCPYDAPCITAIHAEANALADAARRGVSLQHSVLYVTMAPCLPCAQLIVSVGVYRVLYLETYRDDTGLKFLQQAGVKAESIAWAFS